MTNVYVVFQYNWKTRAGECQTAQRCRQTGRRQFWQRQRFSVRQHFQVASSFLFRLPWRKAAGGESDHLPPSGAETENSSRLTPTPHSISWRNAWTVTPQSRDLLEKPVVAHLSRYPASYFYVDFGIETR
jgi:hypothetical protein